MKDLDSGGILIVNSDAFDLSNLTKAGYDANPLENPDLVKKYRMIRVPMTKLNREAVAEFKLSTRDADRCRNFFALGLVCWMYERPMDPTLKWVKEKFAKNAAIMEANTPALKAGYNYGETVEVMPVHYRIPKAKLPPGTYRKITGNDALTMGLVAATQLASKQLVYCSYPITPASSILEDSPT